jgi:heat shock protein HslJ
MTFAWKWLLPLFVVQGLAACGNLSPQAEQAPQAETLSAYHWQLRQALDAQGVAQTGWGKVQLDFNKGRMQVGGLCNALSASYTLDGQQMTVGQAMGTLMACPDTALMALETRVAQRLPEIRRWSLQPAGGPAAAPQLTLGFSDGGRWVLDGTATAETRYGSAAEQVFLEVAPERVPCAHPLMPKDQCLKVRTLSYNAQGLKQSTGPWENFYGEIEGYTHQTGVRNVLRLKRYTRSQVPADASKYVYVLDMTVESERVR